MNFFKKSKEVDSTLIEEIHYEFLTAGDRLLQNAKSQLREIDKNEEQKIQKLKKYGFNNVKQITETESERIKAQWGKSLIEAICDFNIKYVGYKFITHSIALSICKKYNLVLGDVDQYKGFVPTKNLKEIDDFYNKFPDLLVVKKQIRYGGMIFLMPYVLETNNTRICAPLKDMKTEGYSLSGRVFSKHVPDPVILSYIKHSNGTSGYIIVTAWGDEASDPLVLNEKLN